MIKACAGSLKNSIGIDRNGFGNDQMILVLSIRDTVHFAERQFVERQFAEKHFAERQFAE